MSSRESMLKAFNTAANSTHAEVSHLIIGLVFSVLFLVCAYILLKLYEDLKKGQMSFGRFWLILIRVILFICILGYFLLR